MFLGCITALPIVVLFSTATMCYEGVSLHQPQWHSHYGYKQQALSRARGCRGSGHNYPIPSIISQKRPLQESGGGAGVNMSNLVHVPVYKQSVKLGFVNCQSVCNKASEIAGYVVDNNIDILALNETWLHPGDVDNHVIGDLTPSGYLFHHIPRVGRGGGVGVLIRNSLSVTKQPKLDASSFESIDLSIKAVSTCIHLLVIYRIPPSKKNKLSPAMFLEEFSKLLENVSTSSGQLIIVGDINIHWDDMKNSERKKLVELLENYDLSQHIEQPTHVHGHTIDMVITRNCDNLLRNVSVDSLISDHHAILAELMCSKPPPVSKTIQYRKLKAIAHQDFINHIKSSSLCNSPQANIDDLVAQYNTDLSNILEIHAPLKTKQFVERPLCPWINEEILKAKRVRRKYERIWRKSLLTVHKEMYIDQKQYVQDLISRAKKQYYNDKVEQCEGDQAKLFKITESLLHQKGKTALPNHLSLADLANDFNTFFENKITKIRVELDQINTEYKPPEITFKGSPLSHFTPATETEISKLIKSSSSASCNLDPIPTSLLRTEFLDTLCPVITNIVNKSLSTGVFPSAFKHALVKPLLKKSSLDHNVFKNYRPVSNLAFVSKIIEKIVAARLRKHLQENNLNESFQSAYKKDHSTETALLRVHNDIMRAIDSGHGIFLILIDLSAAFDTIAHDTLLMLLSELIGIDGVALEWFRSYLNGRTQSVVIDDIVSALLFLLFGVPQGSVLGPLLFCIYILLLGIIIRKHNLNFHTYADDTQIYCSFNVKSMVSAKSALQQISACVSEIRDWMAYFKLKMNDDKTEFIVICSPHFLNTFDQVTVTVGKTIINPSHSARNLGVIFDSNLNMKKQVSSICRSAFGQLRKIGSIRKFLTDDSTAQLIHAFVTSRLDYCNSLLAGLPDLTIAKLQKVQNVAARILTRTRKFDHISPILIDLHWLPVPLRIEYKLHLLTYRALNGSAPIYLTELLHPYVPSRTLRSASDNLLTPIRTKLSTYGDRAFSAVAPRLWNDLPIHIRTAESLTVFKSSLKTHLFKMFLDNPHLYVL